MKIKSLRNWLEEAEQGESEEFIAIALTKEHKLCSVASCSVESMIEMLTTCAEKNVHFQNALMITASYISEKAKQEEKGGKQ